MKTVVTFMITGRNRLGNGRIKENNMIQRYFKNLVLRGLVIISLVISGLLFIPLFVCEFVIRTCLATFIFPMVWLMSGKLLNPWRSIKGHDAASTLIFALPDWFYDKLD